MRLKRTLTIAAAGGALAAWLAAAATTGVRPPAMLSPSAPPALEARGADLTREIERLHERLRPTSAPHEPARNLFQFSTAPRPFAVSAPSGAGALTEPPVPAMPSPPPVKLVGIAEDAGEGGAIVRTAIVSAPGQTVLAREGEPVGSRYRVEKISADAVELTDLASGAPLRLVLK